VLSFRNPKAEAGVDANKRMDEATSEYLKKNRESIKIKKYEE
jgi:hypothetical protein